MPGDKIKVALLIPDISEENQEFINLCEKLNKSKFIAKTKIFFYPASSQLQQFGPDLIISIENLYQKVFLKHGLHFCVIMNQSLLDREGQQINEFIDLNADVYLTDNDEIAEKISFSKPVEKLSKIIERHKAQKKGKIIETESNIDSIITDEYIIDLYKKYIDKYGIKPLLQENIIMDDYIRNTPSELLLMKTFIEEYKILNSKITHLKEQLVMYEKNRQPGKMIPVLKELILLDAGNKELLFKLKSVLKELNLEEFYKPLQEFEMKNDENENRENKNILAYEEVEKSINSGEYEIAQTLLYEYLEEYPSDQYLMYLQSRIFYFKQDYLKAKVILEDILSTNPDFILARNDLAIVYHLCGADSKAIDCLKYAINNNNYDYNIIRNLADLFSHNELFEDALLTYKKILSEYPEDTEVLKILSDLSLEAGFNEDALLYLKHAQNIEPENKSISEKINSLAEENNNKVITPPAVSIVILTYNNLKYTRETIKSVIKYSRHPYEIIVVDNGSTDQTVNYLKNNNSLNVILNSKNLGFAKGCNQAISVSKGDFIVILNNDVIVSENWLDRLLVYFESDKNLGIVGPVTNYISGPQLDTNFLKLGVKQEQILENGDDILQSYSERLYSDFKNQGKYFPRITGFCMAVSRELIDTIGGFDEQYGVGNFEDDDFCTRAMLAGYKAMIAADVFIYHFGSKSFNLIGEDKYKEIISENKTKFIKKFGKTSEEIFIKKEKIEYEINQYYGYENSSLTKHQNGDKRLGLCMIVKNEEKNLQRCLNSVIDLVDEIIIVDTGSTDNTKETAKKYGAKYYSCKWNDDFSEARNYSLEKAESDWILVLDADEELSSDSAVLLLDSINTSLIDAYSVKVRNLLSEDSFSGNELFFLTRLFRNNKRYRYEGIVHEQIKNSILQNGGKIEESTITIIHHGYKGINKEKIDRNSKLLLEALKKEPENPYYLYQLGITYFADNENESSIDYLLKAYECSEKKTEVLTGEIKEKLIIKISQYYLQNNEPDKSEKYISKLIESNSKNPIARYVYAAALFVQEKYRESLSVLIELEKELSQKNELSIDMHQIYVDLGNNFYILEDYDKAFTAFQKALEINNSSYIACFNLGNLLFRIGHYEDAKSMFEWSLKLNPKLKKAAEFIERINKVNLANNDNE